MIRLAQWRHYWLLGQMWITKRWWCSLCRNFCMLSFDWQKTIYLLLSIMVSPSLEWDYIPILLHSRGWWLNPCDYPQIVPLTIVCLCVSPDFRQECCVLCSRGGWPWDGEAPDPERSKPQPPRQGMNWKRSLIPRLSLRKDLRSHAAVRERLRICRNDWVVRITWDDIFSANYSWEGSS